MAIATFSLGSNLGDRSGYLALARDHFIDKFRMVRFSRIYETEPVDLVDQPWFLNQVVEIRTELSPESLLEWARSLEARAGRQRDIPKGPRTLDVDILLYDDLVEEGPDLILPHPRLEMRRHVLVPLRELSPGLVLPGSGRTLEEALERVPDKAKVEPYAPA
ncbi:MAG TPA: 2-amino-4-hydroxy-6-hydroxymethyldihydropteridine diphosphokinase [bacterium]|nr:2-amino-4-hydroxy-6-hydroxymethyldihydropteridine diphosphokinase [bacterium]